jgi:hypothetical protein
MALGPFITYVPPGVYTRTLTEANVANVVAGLRIPIVIGVGQEELEQDNIELVRGSSADIDQQITAEDVSLSWVVDSTNPQHLILGAQDGTRTQFRVRNIPIVDGQGFGRITNNPRTVTVTVGGIPVAVSLVNGQSGVVTLQVPTQPTDVVRCTYFFHRGDTAFTDDLSDQVTSTPAQLTSPGVAPFAITTGSNDLFALSVGGTSYSVVLPQGSLTAAGVKAAIDAAAISNLGTSVFTDNDGLDHVLLTAPISIVIGTGSANGPLGWTANTATNRNAVFRVYNRPIVDGSGGGITTTDTSKVVVKVSGTQIVPSALDGTNGLVTLPSAPPLGSTVTVQYFANTWQDTFDYLPNQLVTTVIRAGISPNRADYISGADFVISNPSPDVSIVHWGTSFVVAAGSTSTGGVPFDKAQITGLLVDDKMWLAPCLAFTDTSVIPAKVSTTDFFLPEVPTTGNGRDTTLGLTLYQSVTNGRQDLTTNRPDLIVARVGRTLRDALGRPAAKVIAVDGTNRRITLKDPLPPDWTVFATFFYSRIEDDTYIFTNTVPGPVGSGQYTVFSGIQNKNLLQVRFGTKSGLAQTVQWPRGVETIPDALHTGAGAAVSELVTVTFGSSPATNAVFTNRNPESYSFFSPYSATWTQKFNAATITANLNTAAPAIVVSGHVTPIQSGPDAGKINVQVGANVLNINVDGVVYPVTLTTGNQTATFIIGQINAVLLLNGVAAFLQIGPATGDYIFTITSATTPGALPGGFDSVSSVRINQGTGEATLGFRTFQSALGTPGAINKAATLLGSLAGPFNITNGLNDILKVRVNGVDYQVQLPAGAAVTAAAVVGAINAVPGLAPATASVGTLTNLNKVRLTSQVNDSTSAILILDGTANAVLGFTQNQAASQVLVTSQEIVDVLMATAGFTTDGFCYVDLINGQNYITFESITVGAATSSVGFANAANSAFNTTTGIGITPGTDGDNGEDAQQNYAVTSNNPAGSVGTGIPGQTYTDSRTGLRFTVLPASTGSYSPAGSFTLSVSPTFLVDPSRPWYAIGGLETTVSNTVGVFPNDTGTVQTFNPAGVEPAIGDFYYISYQFLKQDFSAQLYRQLKTIEANFGVVSATNRVSLAAYLAILNGALIVGIKQVLKVPNTNQASDSSFITAIQDLAMPLPGNIKPDIIVPLATSTAVYAFLTQHCETQSLPQNQAERMGFIGFASGTTPTTAQAVAQALVSNRIVAFYPDSAVITLTDELGNAFESLVDGSFFAAAVSGAVVSPTVDVATPYTRRRIQGFTRIPRVLDPIEANQTAVKGITILEDLSQLVRIRQGLTTNMASVLTRLPTVTQIADFVQQQSRQALDNFVGTKFLAGRTNEVNVTMTSLFKQLILAEIIGAFTGISSAIDPSDPTVLNFEAFYQPIFPLLYLVLTFNLRARI